MHYVPSQVKEALGISEETLRHWRSVLPPLKGKKGYGPCFSLGDLLALKVVVQLHRFGIPMRQLKPSAERLFEACTQGPWFSLSSKVLVFDGEVVELLGLGQGAVEWAHRSHVSIPLAPLIDQLRYSLSEGSRPAQPEIAFPPHEVGSVRR